MRPARLLLAVLGACAGATAQQAYEFVVDDEPAEVHFVAVEGPRGKPSPGDVVWVGGFEFVLDAPGTTRFEWREGNLYRIDGDRRVLVGLCVREAAHLAALSDAEHARLGSIEFTSWSSEFSDRLRKLDPRCFVRFAPGANLHDLDELPAHLRYLDLGYSGVTHLDGIERLRDLRLLRARHDEILVSVAPVAALRALRHLDLESTGVRDLTPLDGHPTLRYLRAPHAPIAKLPQVALPALTDLVAFDSGCPDEEVARFRALQPRARVVTKRRELLVEAVAGAARVRLRTGRTDHASEQDRELCSITDEGEIAALVALLQTEERHREQVVVPGHEAHVLEFFAADGRMLLELGVFDDGGLSSFPLWGLTPASGTPEAAQQLRAWLAGHGANLDR